MLLLINGECLLNPDEIAEASPKRTDNPSYIPPMKTGDVEITGNGQEPYTEVVQVIFKNGHKRIITMKFDIFCKELETKINAAQK
tara:strand:- start:2208 stop:2462 length:255 start_codon:yes stop_codon:yes gene_type:complete